MKGRWKRPISGMKWYKATKKDFAALPADVSAADPTAIGVTASCGGQPLLLERAAEGLARRQPRDLVDEHDVADALVAGERVGDQLPAAPRR